jgi:hypothetical protein
MTKRTINKIIIGLLALISLLFLVDIITGIWYWNRFNLKFSDSVFNNIITPLSGLLSIIIYSIALFITIRQNKIINSHSLKESYLKGISRFKTDANNIKVELKGLFDTNFLNFRTIINEIFMQLWRNNDYIKDTQNREKKISQSKLETKTYYPQILFLQEFYLKHTLNHGYYSGLKQFIDEILLSDLIENHKKMVINEIETELLHDYLSLISDMVTLSKININGESPYLILTLSLPDLEHEWKSIERTEFRKFYDWYKERITNAYA